MTLFSAESDESYRAMFYKYGAATAQPQQPKAEVAKPVV
jgi:elongation factor 1-beta